MIPRWLWIVIAVVAIYLLWQWMGSGGQSYGPIKVIYDKIGQARDAAGTPFASWGGLSHPSR